MALASLSNSLFLSCFKYKGVRIRQLVLPLPVELLSLRAADGPGERLLAILPYAISVLVLSPIVEEIYFTRIVLSALLNRLGLVAGACLTASIFRCFTREPTCCPTKHGYLSLSSPAHSSPPVHSTTARARSTLLSPRTRYATLPSFFWSQRAVLVGALWVLWDRTERGLSLAAELKVGHALEDL